MIDEAKITIRDVESLEEIVAVEDLQMEAWGRDERSVVPLTQFVASRAVGGLLVGAFDGRELVGFAYGFLGAVGGHFVFHSHMLAVKPSHRNLNLGFRLKLAQREQVIAGGLTTRITWTFDPLQSLNAHFNFAKLGVLSDTYKVNIYGEQTTSVLHRNGTDRFFVTWLLDSRRVERRLHERQNSDHTHTDFDNSPSLLEVAGDDAPHRTAESERNLNDLGAQALRVEIPADINRIERVDMQLARAWRKATREVFTAAVAAGYVATEFLRATRDNRRIGVYLLRRGKLDEFAA